jgi:hypothetical protein
MQMETITERAVEVCVKPNCVLSAGGPMADLCECNDEYSVFITRGKFLEL